MSILPVLGRPGPQTPVRLVHKHIMQTGSVGYAAGGGLIVTALSRDITNTVAPQLLSPGLLMGKVTSTGYWTPSIIGVTQAATLANATSLTLTAAAATELVRRNGASGTFALIGPPTANGTVATQTVTYSSVNTTTGVVTCSAISAATVSGSFVGGGDGSEVPRSFIGDGYGITLGIDPANGPTLVEWMYIPREGVYDVAQIVNWPTDTSLQQYIRSNLDATGRNNLLASDTM